MKLSKRQLRKIVKEEKTRLLEYGSLEAHGPDDYTTYVVRPTTFVDAAEEYLTDEELASIGRDKIERIAIDNANELAWETAGSQEGFGSSDRSAYIKYYLDDLGRYAGFTMDWKGPMGTLQVVREGKTRTTKRQLRRIIQEIVFLEQDVYRRPEYDYKPGFEFEGMYITDASMDETGRFEVDPAEYYGQAYLNSPLNPDYVE